MASLEEPQMLEVKIEIDIAEEPRPDWITQGQLFTEESTFDQQPEKDEIHPEAEDLIAASHPWGSVKCEPVEQVDYHQDPTKEAVKERWTPRISGIKEEPAADTGIKTELLYPCAAPGVMGIQTEPLDLRQGQGIKSVTINVGPWITAGKPEPTEHTHNRPDMTKTSLLGQTAGSCIPWHQLPEPLMELNTQCETPFCCDLSPRPVKQQTAVYSDHIGRESGKDVSEMQLEASASFEWDISGDVGRRIGSKAVEENLGFDSPLNVVRVVAINDVQNEEYRTGEGSSVKTEWSESSATTMRTTSVFTKSDAGDESGDFASEVRRGVAMETHRRASTTRTTSDQEGGMTMSPDHHQNHEEPPSAGVEDHRLLHASRTTVDGAPRSLSCDVCLKTFTCAANLRVHKMIHTGEKPFACDVCCKAFTRAYHLKLHKMIHTGEKPFVCDLCGKVFSQAKQLKNHKIRHTDQTTFECDVCNKTFTRSSNLKVHKMIHTGEKPFQCELCKKVFTRASHLNNHRKCHTGEKPFACDICSKTFTRAGNLKTHKKIHSGEKPYICDACGKSFTQAAQLKVHERIHSSRKPFMCDVCCKSFSYASSLKIHKRHHTGEKSFGCDVCLKTFTCAHVLKNHMKTHNERDFPCDVCGKKFKQAMHAEKHKVLHTGEKPFMCDLCGRTFAQSGNLKKHRMTHSDLKVYGI